jgi:hypothetical protein
MNTSKQQYIDFYRAGGLPLFKDGKENRGSSARCAFWNGYHGLKQNYGQIGSNAYYAWQAGKYCAKFIV